MYAKYQYQAINIKFKKNKNADNYKIRWMDYELFEKFIFLINVDPK